VFIFITVFEGNLTIKESEEYQKLEDFMKQNFSSIAVLLKKAILENEVCLFFLKLFIMRPV
jgi:hypothetical protein